MEAEVKQGQVVKLTTDDALIRSVCMYQCPRTDHEVIRCSGALYYWCSRDMTGHLIERYKELKR